jgi:hypothetical protein
LDVQPVIYCLILVPTQGFAERFLNVLSVRAGGFSLVLPGNLGGSLNLRELLFWQTKENDDDGFWSSLFLTVLT